MGFFNVRKNPSKNLMDSDTYDKLLKRISERDSEVATLKSKVEVLQQDVTSLRGKMSTKLRDLQKEYNLTEEESSLSDGYLPFG